MTGSPAMGQDTYKYDKGPGCDGNSTASTPTTRSIRSPAFSPPHALARRGSPSQGTMYFSPVPQKTISVLHRPANPPMSQATAENLDVMFEKDKRAAERTANGYRRLAQEKWHHNNPGTPTILEQGHIVDKGRNRAALDARGVFDPILSYFKVSPAAGVTPEKPTRPSSAPRMRGSGSSFSPWRGDKALQEARGVRDPITGTVKSGFEPQASYEDRKQLEFERNYGGRGVYSRASKDWSFNPITAEYKPVSPAVKERPRPQSAPRGSTYTATVTKGLDRPNTPSRRPVANGPSWGTYNPISHQWQVPPSDAKFRDPSAQLEKEHGLPGNRAGKVARPANQGVYNPILNTWTVPPANPRIIEGLAFAPATMFTRVTPATLRSPN